MPFGEVLGQNLQAAGHSGNLEFCPSFPLPSKTPRNTQFLCHSGGFSAKPQDVSLAHFKEVPGW